MDYNLSLSLTHLASVKIATELWNQTDITNQLENSVELKSHYPVFNHWEKIEDMVLAKVPQLLLPNSLKVRLNNVIKQIGIQLKKKISTIACATERIVECSCYSQEYYLSYCVTPEKTDVENFLSNDNNFNMDRRFRFSEKYFSEDLTAVLWDELGAGDRIYFCCVNHPFDSHVIFILFYNQYDSDGECIECFIQKLMSTLNRSRNEILTQLAIEQENWTAFRHFWNLMSETEKSSNIIEFAGNEQNLWNRMCPSILFHLLSEMNSEQQIEVFSKPYQAVYILRCLIADWSRLNFVLPTIELMWNFLNGKEYLRVLVMISDRLNDDDDYQNVFESVWIQSPAYLKQFVVGNSFVFFEAGGNLKSVQLILKNATLEEKKLIVYSETGVSKCMNLILENDFKLLQIFIDALRSDYEIGVFKSELLCRQKSYLCLNLVGLRKWQTMEYLVDFFADFGGGGKNEFANLAGRKVCNRLIELNELHLIDEFLDWCFPSRNEKLKFSREVLLVNGGAEAVDRSICITSLYNGLLSFADKFVGECFSFEEDANQFKMDLMLSENSFKMFTDLIKGKWLHAKVLVHPSKSEFIEATVGWFNPSKFCILLFIKDYKSFVIDWDWDHDVFVQFLDDY